MVEVPDSRRAERVTNLYEPACALPPASREAFVRRLAGQDTALAGEVLAMLRFAEAEARRPPAAGAEAGLLAGSRSQPLQIGPYKILDTLGEGGMGTVYLAEQSQPVQRKVALKLIKLGMDSKAVVARFEQERQALALMQHDGIAKVFDCGTSDRGQPYFVMELVKGIPLTEFCEQKKLSLPDRLSLMRQVCAAVQHAHQKGVAHRDLKPGNVLVSDDSGKPQVKIIDFGLAKSMGQRLVEATLFTQIGQVVGTPEYMAPEQADPTNADIDTRADIYSLGVMLYEVLVGSLPFSGPELREMGLAEMQRVLRDVDPPKPSTRLTSTVGSSSAVAFSRQMSTQALQKALRNDLDWVVLKAMEKDRNRRYETANALSADLQRFLDHEPLVAGPPSATYRLSKLLRRHRGQVLAGVAVLIALIGGGIGTFVQYLRADANATLAQQNEQIANHRAAENADLAEAATQAKEAAWREKGRADAKVREFDQLAGVVLYDRAIANEANLYPAWPSRIEAMENWLQNDAGKLLAMRPEIEQAVRAIETRAPPLTAAEREADRRTHPRFAEFELLTQRVASLRRAQAIREGTALLVVPELDAAQRALTADALNALAWDRVAPPDKNAQAVQRKVFGEEPLALAFARTAVDRSKGTGVEYQMLDTLVWALFANGQDAEARSVSASARDLAPAADRADFENYERRLGALITQAAVELAAAETELADLTAGVNQRRTFRFELESQAFLQAALADLLAKLGSLASREKVQVEHRLAWARQVRDLSLVHANARHTWPAVRAAIASNAKYAGQRIELRDEDITGLVPIGENPVTKLWEFYHLRSAWNGKSDPRTIPVPAHTPNGSIEVTGDTGIVFVLLPGGTFTKGAQKDDENAPNFDPQTEANETPQEVTLAPFFMARHELTQGQWARLWNGEPRLWQPSQYRAERRNYIGGRITWSDPVEQVDWWMCDLLLARQGLVLPTEAQWEYGARAGTTTPWWPGREPSSLDGKANVLDATGARGVAGVVAERFDDRHFVHAPVGTFAPNAFGLYDVHGNVWEWCRDEYGNDAGQLRASDGLRLGGTGTGDRVLRGGSFNKPASVARSANRDHGVPTYGAAAVGLRAARQVTH